LCDSCGFTTLDAPISGEINEIRLTFTGGPMECYGVAFDGNSGVQVDNIPMRGSSGTISKNGSDAFLNSKYLSFSQSCFSFNMEGIQFPM